MANLFREAKELLQKKDSGAELTEEELRLINTAEIPLMLPGCPFSDGITISEALNELAKIVEQAQKMLKGIV